MPIIKPVSDLRNYTDVLNDVSVDSPVFLTKNGRGRYAILDMYDYEKKESTIQLYAALANGQIQGDRKGWLDSFDMRRRFAERHAEI